MYGSGHSVKSDLTARPGNMKFHRTPCSVAGFYGKLENNSPGPDRLHPLIASARHSFSNFKMLHLQSGVMVAILEHHMLPQFSLGGSLQGREPILLSSCMLAVRAPSGT
jgi:hypothetical protein